MVPAMRPTSSGVTDRGLVRRLNEDAVFVDEDLGLFVVADGMGGHQAGEVASRLAVETVEAFVRRSALDDDFTWPFGLDPTLSLEANRLRTALQLANRRVFQASESCDEYAGMGTTAVAALVGDSRIAVGHVGDSRLYRLRGDCMEQLTQDDSWVSALRGRDPAVMVSSEHPMQNVLTSVLGVCERVDVHMSEFLRVDGDALLLCSDGLHGVLPEADLSRLLRASPDPAEAVHGLVAAALAAGTRDNISAIVVRCGGLAG